jgi:hypothetical protein
MKWFSIPLLALALSFGGCTNNQIDPQKVADSIKTACGILVVAAQVADILKLDPTLSASAIVSLICTGFTNAQASGALASAPPHGEVIFTVLVNGKPVQIEATR